MIIDKMINRISLDTSELTEEDWSNLEIKYATIEQRITMQIEQALIKWVGEKIDAEDANKKPKVYYRRGRWE